jgi:glucose/arabinose dehydrogenase
MKIQVLAPAATLLLSGTFQAAPPIRAVTYATGLQSPTALVQDPGDRNIFFALEQAGRIRLIRNRIIEQDFLDLRSVVLSGGERGLLGMALAPDFVRSGRFFVNFTNANGDTVIARFRRQSVVSADPGSRFDLKWAPSGSPVIPQPYANHNGGHLAFGPDGYLYIGLGDGGNANDPQNNAQSPSSLLGKMLRIDVNVPDTHPSGYVVPADNPFVGGSPVQALTEIWSFGLRNPWRYCFDDPSAGGTGALVIADVGQGAWEEIDYEPRGRGGRNYGWRNREGAHANVQSQPSAFLPLVDPVYEYGHDQGQSITGGYVYRGRSLGERFAGRYFFADYVSGRVWSIAFTINPATGEARATGAIDHTSELGGAAVLGNISSFAVDTDGELFVLSHNRGAILRLIGDPTVPAAPRIIR